jgi:uncharacterized protein YeaO (DUF488 family)
MAIRIVRLGSPRAADEGLRLGTVRRPPRGVPKGQLASRDFYDVWTPEAAPSEALLKTARSAPSEILRKTERSGIVGGQGKPGDDLARWKAFVRRYRGEMKRPEAARLLDLLAALSHQTNLSVGCYCENDERCHRSVLRALLEERGAALL